MNRTGTGRRDHRGLHKMGKHRHSVMSECQARGRSALQPRLASCWLGDANSCGPKGIWVEVDWTCVWELFTNTAVPPRISPHLIQTANPKGGGIEFITFLVCLTVWTPQVNMSQFGLTVEWSNVILFLVTEYYTWKCAPGWPWSAFKLALFLSSYSATTFWG